MRREEGDFSLQGRVDDLRNAISHVLTLHEPTGIVLLGTNTGASIAICVAADDPRVSAAGLLSPRADFDDWAEHPRRFLEHARDIGAIHRRDFPPSVEEWTREFRRFRPVASARRFAPRPLLVMHGEEDDRVPVSDARQLVNAHGSAELIMFFAARAVGWDPWATATWGRWDTGLYLSIADDGYVYERCVGVVNRGPEDWCGNSGWFPEYPYLMRVGSWFVPGHDTIGRVVSFAAMVGTWAALWFRFLRRRPLAAGVPT